jgi:hypothetical protein
VRAGKGSQFMAMAVTEVALKIVLAAKEGNWSTEVAIEENPKIEVKAIEGTLRVSMVEVSEGIR